MQRGSRRVAAAALVSHIKIYSSYLPISLVHIYERRVCGCVYARVIGYKVPCKPQHPPNWNNDDISRVIRIYIYVGGAQRQASILYTRGIYSAVTDWLQALLCMCVCVREKSADIERNTLVNRWDFTGLRGIKPASGKFYLAATTLLHTPS